MVLQPAVQVCDAALRRPCVLSAELSKSLVGLTLRSKLAGKPQLTGIGGVARRRRLLDYSGGSSVGGCGSGCYDFDDGLYGAEASEFPSALLGVSLPQGSDMSLLLAAAVGNRGTAIESAGARAAKGLKLSAEAHGSASRAGSSNAGATERLRSAEPTALRASTPTAPAAPVARSTAQASSHSPVRPARTPSPPRTPSVRHSAPSPSRSRPPSAPSPSSRQPTSRPSSVPSPACRHQPQQSARPSVALASGAAPLTAGAARRRHSRPPLPASSAGSDGCAGVVMDVSSAGQRSSANPLARGRVRCPPGRHCGERVRVPTIFASPLEATAAVVLA
eukprot:TRINITY_DN71401_c0_g1_i1.p1 TRINITY_DN71401_c0_g1~~TRINITY_DN71401_c0_g1_i1.p1  ORF type:complete len:359 (+),score=63.68 TRINITY_DN71401_c0_g1_i1:76-1077(+)